MDQKNILSVKLDRKDKSQTVTINYFYPELQRNRSEEINDVPHPDFMTAIINLSPFLARVFYVNPEAEHNVVATGMKFSKENCVIITGKIATSSGSVVGVASPAINLEELDVYDFSGIEHDLEDVVSSLAVESLLLLNGTKLGVRQMTIDEQKNEEPVNDPAGLFANADVEEQNSEQEDDITEETREEEDDFLNNDPPSDDEFALPTEVPNTKSKKK